MPILRVKRSQQMLFYIGETPVGSAANLVISRPATILPQQPTGGATIHRVNIGEEQHSNAAQQHPAAVTLTSQGLLTQATVVPGNNRPGILRRREGDRDQAVPGSPRPPGEVVDAARSKKADDEADDDDGGSNSSGSTTLSATSTCDNNNFSADEANAASGGLQVSKINKFPELPNNSYSSFPAEPSQEAQEAAAGLGACRPRAQGRVPRQQQQ